MLKHTFAIAISLSAVCVLVAGAYSQPTRTRERDPRMRASRLNSAQATAPVTATSSRHDIDTDVWSVFVATVAADDIVRMGEVYFPNAVLVGPNDTKPIKDTLERWGRDMLAAKAKGNRATVEFRFSRRQDDAATAFESGIFKYTVIEKSGVSTSRFRPFEQLLVKMDGKWRVLMERQFPEVSQDAWDKLPQ